MCRIGWSPLSLTGFLLVREVSMQTAGQEIFFLFFLLMVETGKKKPKPTRYPWLQENKAMTTAAGRIVRYPELAFNFPYFLRSYNDCNSSDIRGHFHFLLMQTPPWRCMCSVPVQSVTISEKCCLLYKVLRFHLKDKYNKFPANSENKE